MYCPSAGKEIQEFSPSETFVRLSVGFFSSILKRFGLQAANKTRSSDLLSDSTCCAPLALDSVTIAFEITVSLAHPSEQNLRLPLILGEARPAKYEEGDRRHDRRPC